ncbi:telethonin [Clinocottus analis]|uniref:telethonin n=1 Tax=Clinocottus analis TaxID=304258 RepID=UPI0035BFC693
MHCVSRGGCYLVNSFCDLQEENKWRKESYQECWLSLVLETRPQYKLTLSETDSIRRESYKQQQVADFLVERSPSQTLRLGSNSRVTTEHRLPFFNTSKLRHAPPTSGCTEQQPAGNGVGEQEVTATTRELCKPANFRASSLMFSPRESCHRVQRRE